MSSRLWSGSKLLAPFVLAGGLVSCLHANAADLYGDDPRPTYGSRYVDPRYAERYDRGDAYRPDNRFFESPPPRAGIYREDRFAERPRGSCPSKDEISQTLERDGWRGFHNPQVIDRERATVDAQRPNGRPFRLEVDRCTGQVLAERPLDTPRYGYRGDGFVPYAEYGRRPRRPY